MLPVSALNLTADLSTLGRPQLNAGLFGGCRRSDLHDRFHQTPSIFLKAICCYQLRR
jgi:hypothetical protein